LISRGAPVARRHGRASRPCGPRIRLRPGIRLPHDPDPADGLQRCQRRLRRQPGRRYELVHDRQQHLQGARTCLRVVGNRATIGTDWPFSSAGRFRYVEDNPGKNADRLDEDAPASPPTTSPDPPTTITDNDAAGGDIHVVDNFDPPPGD